MQKHFPVGATQAKVLKALGLTADNFDHANAIFDHYGITVSSKREGRETVPVIRFRETTDGAFNAYGEGETWDIPAEPIDLTPVVQWMSEQDAARVLAQASAKVTQDEDADEDDRTAVDVVTTLLSESVPSVGTSAQMSVNGRHAGTEMVSFRRGSEWYAVLQGCDTDGNFFESEDIGPFDSREEAEAEARFYYDDSLRSAEDYEPAY